MCPFVEMRTNFPHAAYNECEFKVIGHIVVSTFFQRKKSFTDCKSSGKRIHLNIMKLFLTNQSKDQFVESNFILLLLMCGSVPTHLNFLMFLINYWITNLMLNPVRRYVYFMYCENEFYTVYNLNVTSQLTAFGL